MLEAQTDNDAGIYRHLLIQLLLSSRLIIEYITMSCQRLRLNNDAETFSISYINYYPGVWGWGVYQYVFSTAYGQLETSTRCCFNAVSQ